MHPTDLQEALDYLNKKLSNNHSNISSVNSEKNYLNKTAKEIDINNIIEGKNNNIRCNFVNNINIYSNNCKQDNSNNIYIGHNSKKYSGNTSFRGIVKNTNLNGNKLQLYDKTYFYIKLFFQVSIIYR